MYNKLKGCIPGIPRTNYVLYRTENLVNSKYYYGVHATDNLEDGYLGSGGTLKKAIRKYGRENFVRTDLEFFNTMEEAYAREAEIVTKDTIKDPNCYNSKPGGLGGTRGMTTIFFQGEYRKVPVEQLDEYLKLGAEHKSRIKGRPSPLRGRKQSEEHLRHRSEALKGHNGYPGRKKPDGFGEKIRQARLGTTGHTAGKVTVWKEGITKYVPEEEYQTYLSDGWVSTKEYRVVVREGEYPILIPRSKVGVYLKDGYQKSTYTRLNLEYNNGRKNNGQG